MFISVIEDWGEKTDSRDRKSRGVPRALLHLHTVGEAASPLLLAGLTFPSAFCTNH